MGHSEAMRPESLELWQSAAIALALGLLIGAERERNKHAGAGVRTFALVGLVGYVSTLLPQPIGVLILGGIAILVAVGYAGTRGSDPGMTTEVALLATAALGALTPIHPSMAVGAAVTIAVLLMSKSTLHHFLRTTVTERERIDALKFFVAAFVVLPLLPGEGFGPSGVLSPQKIWLLVVLITGVGWLGYAATRALGARRGLMVAGLAGGFVSATATIASMGTRVRHGEASTKAALTGVTMASVATLVEVAALTTVVDRAVAARLYPAMAAGIVVLLAESWFFARSESSTDAEQSTNSRPFALAPALLLALVISAVVLLGSWMEDKYGASGAIAVAATGGLADAHATAVALAGLAHQHQLSVAAAAGAIALALATNTLSKIVAAGIAGGWAFGARVLGLHFLPAVAVGVGVMVISV